MKGIVNEGVSVGSVGTASVIERRAQSLTITGIERELNGSTPEVVDSVRISERVFSKSVLRLSS